MEDAAIRLFAAKGLAATTIREIAAQAGVAEGALYRHWSGKNEMAWQLYCLEVARFTAALEPMLAGGAAPLADRLLAAVTFIYRFYRDRPDRLVFALLMRESFPQQHTLDEAVDPDVAVVRFIEREIAAGAVAPGDPALLMSMGRGLVLEPILMHRYGRLRTPPVELAGQVAAACARVLEGQGHGPNGQQ